MPKQKKIKFEGVPADPNKRAVIDAYVQEALEHCKAIDLAKSRLDEVFDVIKENREKHEIELKLFKNMVAMAHDSEKKKGTLKDLEEAQEGLDILRIKY